MYIILIIYIDFWASWCLPCRKETPYLQELHNSYKNSSSIVFISIAVGDKKKECEKALAQDTPSWLQLFDNTKNTDAMYAITEIPKFILIDKNGNISNYNAPAPSEKEILVNLINQELKK